MDPAVFLWSRLASASLPLCLPCHLPLVPKPGARAGEPPVPGGSEAPGVVHPRGGECETWGGPSPWGGV